MKSLFEITAERAAAILRQHGFVPLSEREKAEVEASKAEALKREPVCYRDTPAELKAEREASLKRRLAEVDHYGVRDRAWG